MAAEENAGASFHKERSDVKPLLKHALLHQEAIKEEDSDFLGKTIFKKIYGLDRLWILLFVVAGIAGPALRVHIEGFGGLMIDDTCLVAACLCVIVSILRAVDSPIFIRMYNEKGYGRPLHWFTKWSIVINILIAVVRLFIIHAFPTEGWSHLGGLFVFNSLFIILPFTRLTTDMCRAAAVGVVKEIEESPDAGKWSRVLRKLMILRGDFEAFWVLRAGGGPWAFLILTEIGGAFVYGTRFLARPDEPKWAGAFFVWVFAFLISLRPLARVTSACTSKSSYSRSISAAATRWYFPKENEELKMPDEDFRAYQRAVNYLEVCPTGVRLAGIVINNRLIMTQATRSLIGIPTLYRMVTSAMSASTGGAAHAHTPAASLAGAYVQT